MREVLLAGFTPLPVRSSLVVRCLLAVLIGCACPAPDIAAQGFNTFSGRNHPELDWQVAETPHFTIVYPARLQGIEAEAAALAETTYTALSANLGVTFDRRIRIYLSDEDEILNGFAARVGGDYTAIWVHVNDVAATWSSPAKWLRTVLPHEITHLFHYRAIRPNVPFLDYLTGDPLPRFWAEGLAQYQTEPWDAYRGDQWLRVAVLDDQLSYEDGRSAWNGRLLYAVGNSQLRYFAEQYGDTTLAPLLEHRMDLLFGLIRVHDFYTAFEEVTGESYRSFYDDWRRHVNVYYNTLAGQLETVDSLGTDPLGLPGQYLYDVRYSPDTSRIAVVALTSLRRPVQRLYVVDPEKKTRTIVAEGAIEGPVGWSPDGRRLAFARRSRGPHGSLLNDLFLVDADGKNERRLTVGRRAVSPSFAPDGRRLAFVGASGGTANLFLLDLASGREVPLTHFEGDVQIASVAWHPTDERLAFARFGADGTRDIALLDLRFGTVRSVSCPSLAPCPPAQHGDPVWSPDGRALVYTSLEDDVPNVFTYDLATGTRTRVTHLVGGARAHDWLPPDSAHAAGRLVVTAATSKRGDAAFRIDAARTAPAIDPFVPAAYASWTRNGPPHHVPRVVPPDTSLIERRYRYRPLRNISHVTSLALPYYGDASDWGLVGATSWTEPLGKHLFVLTGSLSIPTPLDNSFVFSTYLNNTWRPTVGLSGYIQLPAVRGYGDRYLVEGLTGGDVSAEWPVDRWARPYTATRVGVRLRFTDIDLFNASDFAGVTDLLPPERGQQVDLRVYGLWKRQRPYRDNVVHPLDGVGVRVRATAGLPLAGDAGRYAEADVAAFVVLPGLALDRLFVYGRARAQFGDPFAQYRLGLTRYDDLQINAPEVGLVYFSDLDRVRGFDTFFYGDRLLFGTVEYRLPFLPDLYTEILGLIGLGATTISLFADGGFVATGADWEGAAKRIGVGVEVKNALRIGGVVEILHAVGIAQPGPAVGTPDDYQIYYRLRTALPF